MSTAGIHGQWSHQSFLYKGDEWGGGSLGKESMHRMAEAVQEVAGVVGSTLSFVGWTASQRI